jgi:hypothetical protein
MAAVDSKTASLAKAHGPAMSVVHAGADGAGAVHSIPVEFEPEQSSERPHGNDTHPRSVPVHRDRNILSVLVGIVGFFAVWGCTAALGGARTVGALLDLPAALLVCLTPAIILTAVYGWAGVADAVAWVFRKPTPGKTAAEAVTFFQLGAAFALAGGFLASMVGLILMLAQTRDLARVGPGLAVALLSQLYGVFLAVVCIAVAAYVARKHAVAQPPSAVFSATGPVAYRAAGVAGITMIAGTLTAMIAFGILMLSLAPNF